MPSNLRPNAITAKRDILRFSKSMVSNTTLKALELVLSPCCTTTITGVSQVCGVGGASATTFTLSAIPNLVGQESQAVIYFSSASTSGFTFVTSNDIVGNTITLNATLGTGVISVHITFYLSLAGALYPVLGQSGGTVVGIVTPEFQFTTTC